MKCFLHIGTEKTGTTVLQDWLYDNRERLSETGIYLSGNIGVPNNNLIPAYFQSHLDDWAMSQGIANEEEKNKYFTGFLGRLTDEIDEAQSKHHTFVITSEHLHSRVRRIEEIQNLHSFLTHVFDEVTSTFKKINQICN